MIEVRKLRYSHNGRPPYLFQSLDYVFGHEKVHVIRGPNGVGKSTLLRILATLVQPTAGEVLYGGKPAMTAIREKLRNRLAFTSGAPLGFYPRLDAFDNLRFFASIRGIVLDEMEVEELLMRVGLTMASGRKKFGEYSLGMRQRLHLARLLLPGSDYFLLDEITNGLDFEGVALCRRLLSEDLHGKVRILISHDTHFVESLSPLVLDLRSAV